MTEFELFQALKPHFPAREYALLPQVANGTGAGSFRHCDALALGLWPSRGMRLHGFEIKSYRGDWMRELKNPEKAEQIAQYCNHWWIVTASLGMVKADELPPLWGLMEYDTDKQTLVKKTAAPFRESSPIGLTFVAAMLRKAQEVVTPDALLQDQYKAGFDAGRKDASERYKRDAEDLKKLKQRLNDFEKASGVRIDGWSKAGDIGNAVRAVLSDSLSERSAQLVGVALKILEELRPGV